MGNKRNSERKRSKRKPTILKLHTSAGGSSPAQSSSPIQIQRTQNLVSSAPVNESDKPESHGAASVKLKLRIPKAQSAFASRAQAGGSLQSRAHIGESTKYYSPNALECRSHTDALKH